MTISNLVNVSESKRIEIYQAWVNGISPGLVSSKLGLAYLTVLKYYVEFDHANH